MKMIIVSFFALIAAVSAEAASYTIKHADGTDGDKATNLAAILKKTFKDGDIIVVDSGETTSVTTQKPAFNPGSGITVTLDLNGQTLSRSSSNTADPVFAVKSGTLIVTNSSANKTGSIPAGKAGRPAITVSGGKLVVEEVEISAYGTTSGSCINVTGGEVEIVSGSFSKGLYNLACSSASSTITISGGEFGGAGTSIIQPCEGMTLNISGGKFAQSVGATISSLSGGLFANKDDDRMVDNPDSSTKSAYPYVGSAVVEDPVFIISGPNRTEPQGYAKAKDLKGVLKEGDVIVLQKDKTVSSEPIELSGDVNVTFDLNGHKYDSTWDVAMTVSGAGMKCELIDSVGGGRLSAKDVNGVVRIGTGTLVLNGASIEAAFNESADEYYSGLELNNGTNTGHFILKSGRVFGSPGMRFSGGGESSVTIEGGIVTSPDVNGSKSLDDAIDIGAGHQFTMTGGEVVGPRAISMSGASPLMMVLKGGTIRSTKANPVLLTYASANVCINLDGATLEGGSCAFSLGTSDSKATVSSGKVNTPLIMDGGVEPILKGGWYVASPSEEDLVITGYRQRALTGCDPYKYEIAPRTGTDTTPTYEVPNNFSGALTVDAKIEKVTGVTGSVQLKVIGTSGSEITQYVTTAADAEGVIKIDLDPAKVEAPTMNEVKFEGEVEGETGIAIPESTPGLTYQLVGGSSLNQIVDIHDEKTGDGAALIFKPDSTKLEGASSAFFRVRVVK